MVKSLTGGQINFIPTDCVSGWPVVTIAQIIMPTCHCWRQLDMTHDKPQERQIRETAVATQKYMHALKFKAMQFFLKYKQALTLLIQIIYRCMLF